jgi:hypothetical protein
MNGFERRATLKELQFERTAIEHYQKAKNTALADEGYTGNTQTMVPSLILPRLGVLDALPASSRIARAAEDKALQTFNRILLMLKNALHVRRSKGLVDDRKWNADWKYFAEYEEIAVEYCYNLKVCFPMYFMHHINPDILAETQWGRFHCPCGRGCYFWRKESVILDLFTDNYWRPLHLDYPDYCRGGQDTHDTLNDLLVHLEGRMGPMHQAAATYLREVYYYLKTPIHSGSIVYNIDDGTTGIKQEEENDFLVASAVVPVEQGDAQDDDQANLQRSKENYGDATAETVTEEDSKPAAKKSKTTDLS